MGTLEEGDNETDAVRGRKKEERIEGEKLAGSLVGSTEERALWTREGARCAQVLR